MSLRSFPGAIAAASTAILFSACAVGPDFERPPAPNVSAYEAAPQPDKTVSTKIGPRRRRAANFVPNGEVSAEWWTLFHSEPLNELIELSLKNNPDLAAADAAQREAHENTEAGMGALLPQVDAGFNGTREKISGQAFGGSSSTTIPAFTLYNASVNISWGIDIFGGTRRQIEVLSAKRNISASSLKPRASA